MTYYKGFSLRCYQSNTKVLHIFVFIIVLPVKAMALDLLDINNDVYKYEAGPGVLKEVRFLVGTLYLISSACRFVT